MITSSSYPQKHFPWHEPAWETLMQRNQKNSLPHALLFIGLEGLGKLHFSLVFSKWLLCAKSEAPCNKCHSCHLFNAESHPDLMLVLPEEPGRIIKIDQIRQVVKFTNETALLNTRRIVIISPASAMNVNARNALLKTLEEPAPNVLIILIDTPSLRLPPTILSRCQKIVFPKPTQSVAIDWLQSQLTTPVPHLSLFLSMAYGAPLKAQELINSDTVTLCQNLYQNLALLAEGKKDPIDVAQQYQNHNSLVLIKLLVIWLQDFMVFKLTQGEGALTHEDSRSYYVKLAEQFPCGKLLDYLDHIKKIYNHLLLSISLNQQLLLEDLFIRWTQHAIS